MDDFGSSKIAEISSKHGLVPCHRTECYGASRRQVDVTRLVLALAGWTVNSADDTHIPYCTVSARLIHDFVTANAFINRSSAGSLEINLLESIIAMPVLARNNGVVDPNARVSCLLALGTRQDMALGASGRWRMR